MIKVLFTLLFFTLLAEASLLDFMTLKKAQKAYEAQDYQHAIDTYKHLKDKNDQAKYNLANSYYKAKKYQEAKALYTQIKEPSLSFNKWHNIGNCEANLGNIDAGIKAYEKALSIKKDSDTTYNLELLKKKKKEKEEQKKRQDKKEKKKEQNKQDKRDQKRSQEKKSDQKKSKNKEQKSNDQKKASQNKKGDNKEKKDNKNGENKKEKEKEKKDAKRKEQQMKQQMSKQQQKEKKDKAKKAEASSMQALKKEPISDKEVRKYLKMLDKRGVNTLLVPLNTKGAKDEEITPW
jgi:Ca-activated chloride channel family protein